MPAVEGLSSGLNTTALIDALMAAERAPQRMLKNQLAVTNATSSAYSALKTSVEAISSSFSDLNKSSTWASVAPTVTFADSAESGAVTAAASASGGSAGSLSFTVDSVATPEVIYSADVVASLDDVVDNSGQTLSQVVDSINGDDSSNTVATAINTGSGYRLQLSSRTSGAAGSVDTDLTQFTSNLPGGFLTLTSGADASITVQGVNSYSITSSDNVFEDLLPGVDVSVSATTTQPVTLEVSRDSEVVADKMEGFVAALNAAFEKMDEYTGVDAETGRGSLLTSNSLIRRANSDLLASVVREVEGASKVAVSLVGLGLDADGKVAFDREAFTTAIADDPDGVQRLFHSDVSTDETIFGRLEAEIELATDSTDGYFSTADDAAKARVRTLDDQIASWDRRLDIRAATLRKTFTSLESSLSRLQGQSAWLTSQLATLPSYGDRDR